MGRDRGSESELTLDDIVAITAAAPDGEILFRQRELLSMLYAADRGTATRWQADLIGAVARLPGNLQQRYADSRARALGLFPANKRDWLIAIYLRALDHVPQPLRDRELRLLRRGLRLLSRERQQAIEAKLPGTRG